MRIMRRVLAILVVVATLFLVGQPAQARAEECTGDCRTQLVQVGLKGRVVQLVADGDGTCALTDAGDVYCWGVDYPDERPGHNPMPLVVIGALLIAGGATLLMISRSSPRQQR